MNTIFYKEKNKEFIYYLKKFKNYLHEIILIPTFNSSLTPSNSSTSVLPKENDEKFAANGEKLADNGEKFEFPKSSAARLHLKIIFYYLLSKNSVFKK